MENRGHRGDSHGTRGAAGRGMTAGGIDRAAKGGDRRGGRGTRQEPAEAGEAGLTGGARVGARLGGAGGAQVDTRLDEADGAGRSLMGGFRGGRCAGRRSGPVGAAGYSFSGGRRRERDLLKIRVPFSMPFRSSFWVSAGRWIVSWQAGLQQPSYCFAQASH